MGIVRKIADTQRTVGGVFPNQQNGRKLQSEFASSRSFGGIVIWRISQLVSNEGAGYDVTSADFTGGEDSYIMGIVQGAMVDYDFAQYQLKKYSIRVVADKAINFPLVINWNKSMSISVAHDAVETEVYTTDGEDNVNMNFSVPLSIGTSDIDVFVYTDEAGGSFKSVIDQSMVGQIVAESGGGGLPAGTENQTIRKGALAWEATSILETLTNRVRVADHPLVGNYGLVNVLPIAVGTAEPLANTTPIGISVPSAQFDSKEIPLSR